MAFFVQFFDELPKLISKLNIHAGCRLIEHNDGRFVHKSLCDHNASFHAAGEQAARGLHLFTQSQTVNNFFNPGVIIFESIVAALEGEHFIDG